MIGCVAELRKNIKFADSCWLAKQQFVDNKASVYQNEQCYQQRDIVSVFASNELVSPGFVFKKMSNPTSKFNAVHVNLAFYPDSVVFCYS